MTRWIKKKTLKVDNSALCSRQTKTNTERKRLKVKAVKCSLWWTVSLRDPRASMWVSLSSGEVQCGASSVRAAYLWVCGFGRAGSVLSQIRLCELQMPPDDKRAEQRWGFTRRASLWLLWITISPLIPHCCRFIAAQERCTNNTASPLARGWARDQQEPIRARQYYMCVVSQY